MPRNYKPKPKNYNELKLEEAVEKLKEGQLSFREAETKYGIDKSLLWRKVHNYNTSKQGRKTVLKKEEEADLAEKIKLMAKWGWALTRKEISDVVHTYIIQNNIKNNFKENYPGKDWMHLFFMRNGLVAKKMEQLEKSRRQATSDPFIIYHFYDILKETLTALDLHDKPKQIFNLDETSFSSDPTRIRGVTGKGQKAHRLIQGSGKDNTTVLGCVSASGILMPPLIIFKGQNLWNSWKGTKDIPGTTYACSDNGWMMTSIFNEWFANFCKTVTERPLLVIFDGHVTHLDPATIELAVRENVALLKLPPHTTDLLQPMDRSCFGPMKYKWNERLIAWQRLNQRVLSKSEFCDLLSDVWRDGLSVEVIQNSFKVTGIFPVNKEVYPKDRLDPAKLERYNKELSTDSIRDPFNVFEFQAVEDIDDRASPSIITMPESNSHSSHPITNDIQQISQDKLIPVTTDAAISFPIDENVSLSDPLTRPEPSCSFETLLLSKIKHTDPTTRKRRKIDGKGKLLTTEEYLKSIENLDLKQKKTKKGKQAERKNTEVKCDTGLESDSGENITKGKGIKKIQRDKAGKPDSETDTDIEEEDIPYQDESDIENMSFSELINDPQDSDSDELHQDDNNTKVSTISIPAKNLIDNNMNKEVSTTDPVCRVDELEYGIGDFILVVHTAKKKETYYIARVEGSDDDDNLSVIYLKRAKKIFFVYPDARIIYSIRKDEIVMKLSPPRQKNKRGALIFDIDLEKYKVG